MRFFLVLTASIVTHIGGNEHGYVKRKINFLHKRSKIKQRKILANVDKLPDTETLSIQKQSTTAQRIVGGEPAPKGRYPYLVTLMNSVHFSCGGALIANSIVLSAAHCFDAVDHILIGHYDLNIWQDDDDAQYIRVIQKIVAPSWNEISFDNDIMLLILDNQIGLNQTNVNINGLVENFDYEQKDSKLTVMGYGTTSEGGNVSNIPLEVEVKLVVQDECNKSYDGKIGKSEFCAADENKDSCQGDSGGPIIVKGSNATDDLVVGVVSWGFGCADPEYPGVYAKFSYKEGPNNFEQLTDLIEECKLPAELQDSDCEAKDKYKCLIGDGICDQIYNTSSCNFDAGDCIGFPDDGFDYANCDVSLPGWIGDNFCDGGFYNTSACNFDGQDCLLFPNDGFNYTDCNVNIPGYIGDDYCDGGDYNTSACNFDGQDCSFIIGDFPDDGFNYTDCIVAIPEYIGDDYCDGGDYNTPNCNFDGNDCSFGIDDFPDDGFNYTDCIVAIPEWIGDTICDVDNNASACNFDGQDCLGFPDDGFNYANCNISIPSWIGDSFCDGEDYNTSACNFDGQDCFFGISTVPTPTSIPSETPSETPTTNPTGTPSRTLFNLNSLVETISSFVESINNVINTSIG